MRTVRYATVVTVAMLSACSGSSTPPASPPTPQAAASSHVKTPWDNLLKDRDKAKAVQKQVDTHAKLQQQAVEKQTQ